MLKLHARTTVTSQLVAKNSFPIETLTLRVAEETLHGIIRIQADGQSVQSTTAIQSALGLELPQPERSTEASGTRLIWVGPNEWLVLCTLEDETIRFDALSARLAGQFATVTLVSDSRVSFKVSGMSAPDFLAKGCAIDLDDKVFPVGAAVTTRFAAQPAMLVRRGRSEFVLYFDVSMAAFLVDWMLDAADEFKN